MIIIDIIYVYYKRFLDITLTAKHNITSGKIYQELIQRERRGVYLGKTVQIIPHATDLIQEWIKEVAKVPVDGSGLCPDVCLIEVQCMQMISIPNSGYSATTL